MLVMGLVPAPSLIVISITGILLYAKYISFIMCFVHVNYIVYKHFDKSMHVRSLDPTYVQNIRPIPPMVFEILGFKLKNKNDHNDKKNWRS